nr:unknown [Zea mays]
MSAAARLHNTTQHNNVHLVNWQSRLENQDSAYRCSGAATARHEWISLLSSSLHSSSHSSSVVCAGAIAWVGLHDERGVVEVAVPGVPAAVGVVEVHGDGGAGHGAVRVVARPALLDHGAAHLGARVVQVLRQDLVRRRRLRDAPRLLSLHETNGAA